MVEKKVFNTIEKSILRLLFQTKAPLTVYEISKEIKVSFPTTQKYLKILLKEGYVSEDEKETEVKLYKFNFSLLRALKRRKQRSRKK